MGKLTLMAFLVAGAISAGATSKPVAQLPMPCESNYQVLSPDGTQLAWWCKGGSVQVRTVPEGKQLRVIPAEERAIFLVYSPDGHWMGIGLHDGSVEVVASDGSEVVKKWKVSHRRIDLLYFLPGRKALVVGPSDESAQVWDISEAPKLTASLPFEFGGMSACAASPDGKVFVVAGGDTVLRWYDTNTWQKTRENNDFLLETFALVFTPNGEHVLAGGADARITVLDATTTGLVRQFPAESGFYVVGLDVLGKNRSAAAIYLDDAGGKPPHGRFWNLADATSVSFPIGAPPSCGAVVSGKFWLCSAEGNSLRIVQFE